jgi:hypothetical protein
MAIRTRRGKSASSIDPQLVRNQNHPKTTHTAKIPSIHTTIVMRPKERLLRRNIPKDAIRRALEDWSDRLPSWNEVFTALVVLGLVIEYLPEIARFLPASVFVVM